MGAEMTVATEYHCRWMVRRDMDEVLGTMRGEPDPWSEELLLEHLRERNRIGNVCCEGDCPGSIRGFMLYELTDEHHLDILVMSVHPDFRRQGVGTVMVRRLQAKLGLQCRRWVTVSVREDFLGGQLFLRHHGFMCDGIDGDRYQFIYRVEWGPES